MGTYDTIGGTPRHNPVFDEDYILCCVECALRNGHNEKEAQNCENGELNCKGCPFTKEG